MKKRKEEREDENQFPEEGTQAGPADILAAEEDEDVIF
jgi:hypothetical protein